MARFDQRGAKGYGKGKNGYSSSGLSRAAHEEVSRTLVRILRYEASKYSLVISPEGWVSLEDLMQKCKGQIKNSPDEVLSVALDSEGSQGKRFEVDASKQWIKARYKHGPGQSGKGKGRGKGDKGDKGNENAGGNTGGWENYQNQQNSYYDYGAKNGGKYGNGEKNGNGSGAEYSRHDWQHQSGEDPWIKNDPWGGWQRYEKKTSPDGATATSTDAGASGAAGTAPDARKPSPSKASRETPPDSRPSNETKPSQTETQQTQQAEATEQATTRKDCDPNRTGSSNGTNGTNATHGPSGTWHRRIDMENLKTSKTPDTSASSSPGVESYDISTPRTKAENWQKFIDPQSGKPWLHHADTGEYFFADRAAERGWSQWDSDVGAWWHHDSTGRWFFDPNVAQ